MQEHAIFFHVSKPRIIPIVNQFILYTENNEFPIFLKFSGREEILKQIENFRVSTPRFFRIVN